MVGVREMTVDGQVTVSSGRRVPKGWIAGATERGLVIQRRHGLAVWDPRTRSAPRRLPLEAVGDVHANRLIGCLRSRCRKLVLVDAASGSRVPARPEPPYRLDLGAEFSPHGSLVATPAVANRRWSVALVDTRTGRTRIVPGSHTGTAYPTLSWARSSGWLFFRAGAGRVRAYRPGTRRAIELPIRLPRRALAFIAE
jgi:hypothetical protein